MRLSEGTLWVGATPLTTVSSKNKFWYQYTFAGKKSQIAALGVSYFVIPVKAGIHKACDFPKWMPAFAGMTDFIQQAIL
jgi:hypothetical protein